MYVYLHLLVEIIKENIIIILQVVRGEKFFDKRESEKNKNEGGGGGRI